MFLVAQGLMASICLRRTKEVGCSPAFHWASFLMPPQMQDNDGRHLVQLPPVEMIQVKVTLSPPERKLYDEVFAISRIHFKQFLAETQAGGRNAVRIRVLMSECVGNGDHAGGDASSRFRTAHSVAAVGPSSEANSGQLSRGTCCYVTQCCSD